MTDDERRAYAAAKDRERRIADECVSELRRTSGLDLHAVVSKGADGPLVTVLERDAQGRDSVRRMWTVEEAWEVCNASKSGRPHAFAAERPAEVSRDTRPPEVVAWVERMRRTGVVPDARDLSTGGG